jgi:hypothetical protein
MTTAPRTLHDPLAARKAVAGVAHCFTGYAGAVADAGVATANGDALAGVSGNIAPISWSTPLRSRNLVASVVTPAA